MKNECTIRSFAKINLSIDVKGKLDNGYHEVDMIMQSISLHDLVIVEWIPEEPAHAGFLYTKNASAESLQTEKVDSSTADGKKIKISLETNRSFLPRDQRNLAYKAAMVMAEEYAGDCRGTVKIYIKKMIPVAAGLAGGSGNGAAVILAINYLWKLDRDLDELLKLSGRLGADVPFCMMTQAKMNSVLGMKMNGHPMASCCAHATGTGTDLEPIRGGIREYLILAKPGISVSTPEVYKGIDNVEIMARPDNVLLKSLVSDGDDCYDTTKRANNGVSKMSISDGLDTKVSKRPGPDEDEGVETITRLNNDVLKSLDPDEKQKMSVNNNIPDNGAENRTFDHEDKEKLIYSNMINVLELYTLKKYPVVMKTKERIREVLKMSNDKAGQEHDVMKRKISGNGALQQGADKAYQIAGQKDKAGNEAVVLMSGSGPTVFGIAETEKQAKEVRDRLKTEYKEVFWAETLV